MVSWMTGGNIFFCFVVVLFCFVFLFLAMSVSKMTSWMVDIKIWLFWMVDVKYGFLDVLCQNVLFFFLDGQCQKLVSWMTAIKTTGLLDGRCKKWFVGCLVSNKLVSWMADVKTGLWDGQCQTFGLLDGFVR